MEQRCVSITRGLTEHSLALRRPRLLNHRRVGAAGGKQHCRGHRVGDRLLTPVEALALCPVPLLSATGAGPAAGPAGTGL